MRYEKLYKEQKNYLASRCDPFGGALDGKSPVSCQVIRATGLDELEFVVGNFEKWYDFRALRLDCWYIELQTN